MYHSGRPALPARGDAAAVTGAGEMRTQGGPEIIAVAHVPFLPSNRASTRIISLRT
jgi:hypothetical protein